MGLDPAHLRPEPAQPPRLLKWHASLAAGTRGRPTPSSPARAGLRVGARLGPHQPQTDRHLLPRLSGGPLGPDLAARARRRLRGGRHAGAAAGADARPAHGQRQADLLALPWSAYDGKALTLRQGKSRRLVYVPATRGARRRPRGGPARADTILVTPQGATWAKRRFHEVWSETATAAGIAALHFHDLRGTAVTIAGGGRLHRAGDRDDHGHSQAHAQRSSTDTGTHAHVGRVGDREAGRSTGGTGKRSRIQGEAGRPEGPRKRKKRPRGR